MTDTDRDHVHDWKRQEGGLGFTRPWPWICVIRPRTGAAFLTECDDELLKGRIHTIYHQ